MEVTGPRLTLAKSKLQDALGKVFFIITLGNRPLRSRCSEFHLLQEEGRIESKVFNSGETLQRVYFGRSV